MKKILNLLIYAVIGVAVYGLNISPFDFTYKLDSGKTERIYTLKNDKDEAVRYRVGLEAVDPNDMSKWIRVSDREIQIREKGTKSFKLSLDTPENLSKGEYRAKLFLEEIDPIETLENLSDFRKFAERKLKELRARFIKTEEVGVKNTGAKLNLKKNLKIDMYGHKGELNVDYSISEIIKDREASTFIGELINKSEKATNVYIEVLGKNDLILRTVNKKLYREEKLDFATLSIYDPDAITLRVRETKESQKTWRVEIK